MSIVTWLRGRFGGAGGGSVSIGKGMQSAPQVAGIQPAAPGAPAPSTTAEQHHDGDEGLLLDRGLSQLVPDALRLLDALKVGAEQQGIAIFLTEGYRTPERQRFLYGLGRTRPGPGATPAKPLGDTVTQIKANGRHQSGRAFDVALRKPPHASAYDDATLHRVGAIGKALGLTWGGDWSFHDTPHFELKS